MLQKAAKLQNNAALPTTSLSAAILGNKAPSQATPSGGAAASTAPEGGHSFSQISVLDPSQETSDSDGQEAASTGLSVQRDDTTGTSLPPVPNVQLPPPSLLQRPDPAARYHLGGNQQLHLDPQLQAQVQQQVQTRLDPATLLSALDRVQLGPLAAPAGGLPGGSPPAAGGAGATTPAAAPDPAGAGADPPHAGSAGDIVGAVVADPAVSAALTRLQTQAMDQVRMDWSRLNTGERIGAVSVTALIGAGILAGVISDPGARRLALDQLNGRMVPVPGLNWMHLEINTQPNSLMLGLHVDVGALLPPSLGFGPSGPSAIGGPPTPEPFVPGQRQSESGAGPTDPSAAPDDVGSRIQARLGGGTPLSPHVQRQLQQGLNADMSGVRVHTDGEADRLSRAIDATAFTTGQDMFFRSGSYAPDSPGGMHLLAHEAAHTVQQRSGPVAGTPTAGGVAVSSPSDHFEQEAQQAAGHVMRQASTTDFSRIPAYSPHTQVQRSLSANQPGESTEQEAVQAAD